MHIKVSACVGNVHSCVTFTASLAGKMFELDNKASWHKWSPCHCIHSSIPVSSLAVENPPAPRKLEAETMRQVERRSGSCEAYL